MFCSKCGDQVEQNEIYCNKCGNYLGNNNVNSQYNNVVSTNIEIFIPFEGLVNIEEEIDRLEKEKEKSSKIRVVLDPPRKGCDIKVLNTNLIRDYGEDVLGTTLSLALINKKNTLILNIGDSRIYTYKEKNLTQITEDDSDVWLPTDNAYLVLNFDIKNANKLILDGIVIEDNLPKLV